MTDIRIYKKEILDKYELKVTKVNDKESYLQFRKDWAHDYMILSAKIRRYKSMRKEYIWEYREKGDAFWPIKNQTDKRKRKIGPNPNYSPTEAFNAIILKEAACNMMIMLEFVKQITQSIKEEQLEAI